jgi:putative ABC transport system substrate-binding protein
MGFPLSQGPPVRHLLVLAGLLAAMPATIAPAQTTAPEGAALIGVLAWGSCAGSGLMAEGSPFRTGLSDLGQVAGETYVIECRDAGTYEGLVPAAAALAALPVDVIVGDNQPVAQAAREATSTIPIVSIISGDPVASGLAESLARPGGNLTGLSYYATELTGKRLDLLKQLLPGLTRLAVLANPDLSYLPFEEDTRRAGDVLGIGLTVYHVRQAAELEDAFARMASDGAEAVFVLPDLVLAYAAPRIAALALDHGLPSMAWGGWFTRAGALMSYSTDYETLSYRLAYYVDRVLGGTSPAELPIEQPTTYQLSVNLATAAALGVDIPEPVLILADEVIE